MTDKMRNYLSDCLFAARPYDPAMGISESLRDKLAWYDTHWLARWEAGGEAAGVAHMLAEDPSMFRSDMGGPLTSEERALLEEWLAEITL